MLLIDYEKICDSILQLDVKIRFVGVYLESRYYKKLRKNTTSYLSEEQTEESLKQALDRWNGRMKFFEEVGFPVYSVTKYQKVYRLTMPFKDGILAFSTEPDMDIETLVDKVLKIRDS